MAQHIFGSRRDVMLGFEPAFPRRVPCRSRCPAFVSLARARTSDDIRPRVHCTPPPKSSLPPDLPAVTTLDARASNLTVSQRPTTRATGHTVPAPAAAAAPEHRCAAARCQVPHHGRPAARRTPAHRRAHARRKPAARPRRDRTAKAAQRRPAPAAHTAQNRVPDKPRVPHCVGRQRLSDKMG